MVQLNWEEKKGQIIIGPLIGLGLGITLPYMIYNLPNESSIFITLFGPITLAEHLIAGIISLSLNVVFVFMLIYNIPVSKWEEMKQFGSPSIGRYIETSFFVIVLFGIPAVISAGVLSFLKLTIF